MYFNSEKIYQKVERLCFEKGWSLYRLAELSNISVNSLYSWRDRKSSPTLYLIESIAKAFDVSPISLLLQEEELGAIQAEHKELFNRWNGLTTEQKSSLMNMLRSFTRDIE
ncbi:MAG: helix-turn-helix domain-containing protein [Clostridia bacterium]|jgi:transcriptional regulator with XRE-family HTH domain|nr:helix-turn-helix domain-containing protein [Clostridia bacterium]